MKTKIFLIVLLSQLGFTKSLLADSPLTSTYFGSVYYDIEVVKLASETDGLLTPELMSYLSDGENPIDYKIAIINELSWSFDGKNNSEIFYEYLNSDHKYKNTKKFLKSADADILICYAYLKALDDYFNVDDAIIYAQKAKEKNKESFTINIVCALIEAQNAFDDDWCELYNLTNNVQLDESLSIDMRE